MKKLRNHLIGIDQGEKMLFSDHEEGGAMWTGEGARRIEAAVSFSERFRAPPAVTVQLALWDTASDSNSRGDLRAEQVTEAGFAIVFRTWGDTRIARVRASWQAIGELRDGDEWEL